MKWVEHVARVVERRGEYRVLVGKLKGKKQLVRPKHRWRIILRWIFRKLDWTCTGLIWVGKGTGGGHL
jgi:hypothetical protein